MSWPVTADGQWYIFEGQVLMPVDPSRGVATLLLRPSGGMGVAVPAIEKGDPGVPANLDTTVNFTALAYNDATADSASMTEITPPTTNTPGLYRLNLAVHKGSPGADGTNVLDVTDYGTPAAGKMLVVNPGATAFIYQSQKVGDLYWPASLNSTPAGNASYTLGVVSIPAQGFDWRPVVFAQTIISGTGPDIRVDLVAHLNGETSGNIVGRRFGVAGVGPIDLSLVPGVPAGSADNYNKVAAGASATVHLRVERQAGSDTFTTSNTTTLFSVKVNPIP